MFRMKYSMFEMKHFMFKVKYSMFEVKHFMFRMKYSMFEVKHFMSRMKHSMFEVKYRMLEVKFGTWLGIKPSRFSKPRRLMGLWNSTNFNHLLHFLVL